MSKKFIITLLAVAVVVLAISVPNFNKARSSRAAAPCINRLMQIDSAKHQWALEQSKTTNDSPTWAEIYPYLSSRFTNVWYTNGTPVCPEGGVYILGRVGKPPTCSLGKQDPNHHVMPE
jgi:hypothetical protein